MNKQNTQGEKENVYVCSSPQWYTTIAAPGLSSISLCDGF